MMEEREKGKEVGWEKKEEEEERGTRSSMIALLCEQFLEMVARQFCHGPLIPRTVAQRT